MLFFGESPFGCVCVGGVGSFCLCVFDWLVGWLVGWSAGWLVGLDFFCLLVCMGCVLEGFLFCFGGVDLRFLLLLSLLFCFCLFVCLFILFCFVFTFVCLFVWLVGWSAG